MCIVILKPKLKEQLDDTFTCYKKVLKKDNQYFSPWLLTKIKLGNNRSSGKVKPKGNLNPSSTTKYSYGIHVFLHLDDCRMYNNVPCPYSLNMNYVILKCTAKKSSIKAIGMGIPAEISALCSKEFCSAVQISVGTLNVLEEVS